MLPTKERNPPIMMHSRKSLLALGLITTLAAGCADDRPHRYGRQQPDVNSLDERDRGLQSKNVIEASDQMTMDLLSQAFVTDSPTQLNVVVRPLKNSTYGRRANYDIFIKRLKTNLATQGHGRIQLIQNRDDYREAQDRELEGERPAPGPAGVQPQYALTGEVNDLPNRGTDYFLFEFRLDDMRTRVTVWSRAYEVKVAR
jgi:hypothetical protein